MGKGKTKSSAKRRAPGKAGVGAARRVLHRWVALGVVALALLAALLILRPWRPRLALPQLTATSVVVLDGESGRVLYDKNGDTPRPPASLTKLMTAYLIFSDLDSGTLSLEDTYRVTRTEADTPGSKYGLHPGMELTVEQLLAGTILNSGCDCVQCLVALSAGDEATFVARMNDTAATLELEGSHFSNAVGLDAADHYMTARDLARLSLALVTDHPEYLDYSSQAELEIGGLPFRNLNVLAGRDPRVVGLKTGTTSIGGNNLVTYARWEGKSYVIVLLDSASEQRRFAETQSILDALYGEVDDG